MGFRFRFRLRLFVAEEYKPLRLVPPLMWLATFAALLGQVAYAVYLLPPPEVRQTNYTTPPAQAFWQVASLGEPETLAKIMALQIQSFDVQPGVSIPFRELDYDKLGLWLDRIVGLDERAEYPHFLMAKVYSTVKYDEARQRQAANWVWRQFLRRPDDRWWWMAHAVGIARHTIKDNALALKMARDLRIHLSPGVAPSWPRQMEAYILESENEFDTAVTILLSQLEAGEITDPQEFSFLLGRLEDIIGKMGEEGQITSRADFEDKLNQLQTLQDKFLAQFGDIAQ